MGLLGEMQAQMYREFPEDPYQMMLDRLAVVMPDDRL
jgi:hypothetical protein